MKGELKINGSDVWTTYGVSMGEGFIDAIDSINEMKQYISNDCREEHGIRVIPSSKVKERELTLHFTIQGNNPSDFRKKKTSFINLLESGVVLRVEIPSIEGVYKLIYLGKGQTYKLSLNKSFCAFGARFLEPNPKDRS